MVSVALLAAAVVSTFTHAASVRVRSSSFRKAFDPKLQHLIADSSLGQCVRGTDNFTWAEQFISRASEFTNFSALAFFGVSQDVAPRSFLLFLAGMQDRFRCQSKLALLRGLDALFSNAVMPTWLPLEKGTFLDWGAESHSVVVCPEGHRGANDALCPPPSSELTCQTLADYAYARSIKADAATIQNEESRLALDPSIFLSRVSDTRQLIKTNAVAKKLVSVNGLRIPGAFSASGFSDLRRASDIITTMKVHDPLHRTQAQVSSLETKDDDFVCATVQSLLLLYAKHIIDSEMKKNGCAPNLDPDGGGKGSVVNEAACNSAMDATLTGVLRRPPPVRLLSLRRDGTENTLRYVNQNGFTEIGYLRVNAHSIDLFSEMPARDGAVYIGDFQNFSRWAPCRGCFSESPSYSYPLLGMSKISCSLPSMAVNSYLVPCLKSELQNLSKVTLEDDQEVEVFVEPPYSDSVTALSPRSKQKPLQLMVSLEFLEKLVWDLHWLARSDLGPANGFLEGGSLEEYPVRPIKLVRWHLSNDLIFANCPSQFGMEWQLPDLGLEMTAMASLHERKTLFKDHFGMLLKSYTLRTVRELSSRNRQHTYSRMVDRALKETANLVSVTHSRQSAEASSTATAKLMQALLPRNTKNISGIEDASVIGPLKRRGTRIGTVTRWLAIYRDTRLPVLCELKYSGGWVLKRVWPMSSRPHVFFDETSKVKRLLVQGPPVSERESAGKSEVREYTVLPQAAVNPQNFVNLFTQVSNATANQRAFRFFQQASCEQECKGHWMKAYGGSTDTGAGKIEGEHGIMSIINFWSCINQFLKNS